MLIYSQYWLTLCFHLYFPLKRVTDAEATKHRHDMSPGDTPGTEHDNEENNDDLQRSHSSTIEGKILRPFIVVRMCVVFQKGNYLSFPHSLFSPEWICKTYGA